MKLTEEICTSAQASNKNQKLFDGHGLYLMITPQGSKIWRLKYRFEGKESTLSFGSYPITTLAEARIMRENARKEIRNGINPSKKRKEKKMATEMGFEQDQNSYLRIVETILNAKTALSEDFGVDKDCYDSKKIPVGLLAPGSHLGLTLDDLEQLAIFSILACEHAVPEAMEILSNFVESSGPRSYSS